ncbi:M15 family metallopeptidase [Lacinutrix sp. Bg11-31]|uniref:M15 family metallopeptidase n=1 Tax=Lacinutrix sp. Bg11-31 TaxID=2057808 RepID=UPI000C308D3F|nr:M15 family metallopeptidase [Lacinutrix sp. Bg11-31]AUC83485.1 D-alanyl-D-alanine carboxypeptidase [Lacinutrix sp. Bg11-31]
MNKYFLIKLTTLIVIALSILPQLTFAQNTISAEELIGKGNPQLFGEGYKLREEAYIAFKKMQAEALKSNIKIGVVSSYRNFAHQKRIWERKFKSNQTKGLSPTINIDKIIEYSTIPGTSRHHWATDIDIYQTNVKQPRGLLLESNFHNNGAFCKLKEWMDIHAKDYGFYLVYTDLPNRKGFKYEPWHYSYKPLSSQYLKAYKQLDIAKILKTDKLLGSKNLTKVFITKYSVENILDINPEFL